MKGKILNFKRQTFRKFKVIYTKVYILYVVFSSGEGEINENNLNFLKRLKIFN